MNIFGYLKRKSEGWWTAASTVVLACFTGVLVVFTALLYCVGEKADETAKVSQRAYVNCKKISPGTKLLSPDGKRATKIQYVLECENGGQTPTKSAIMSISSEEAPQQTVTSSVVLGARSTILAPGDIPIERIKEVNQGKHIRFFGWATYHDRFNGTPMRLTEFCLEIARVQGTTEDLSDPGGNVSFFSTACQDQTHPNCYDEDCADYGERTKGQ